MQEAHKTNPKEDAMIEGVIHVAAIMEQWRRRDAWQQRMARDSEWVALKAWWQAGRRLRSAKTVIQRQEAKQSMERTMQLYRAELRRVWPKWAEVENARRHHDTYRLPAADR